MIDNILSELEKVQVFSIADLKDGFLQNVLNDESSLLARFQAPWGRYRWLQMHMESALHTNTSSRN